MVRIYFLRHGESVGNSLQIRQGAEGGLTECGKIQAKKAAKQISEYPIELVLSSTMERAKETAHIINKKLKLSIEFSPLWSERRRASIEIGKHSIDPEMVEIDNKMRKNFHVNDWRYSDEENFAELKGRTKKALTFLENLKKEHVLVVSHGYFIRALGAYMVFGSALLPEHYLQFGESLDVAHTGIGICDFGRKKTKSAHTGWKIVSWNNHSHLEK
jgi:probable phosphoglycerate mutase